MTGPDDDRTIDPDRTFDPLTSAPTLAVRTPTPTPATGRFAPGAIIGGRYRLVSLLGRGGMGEVYRADDLTLDQPVALKFLPDGVAVSDARLAQFHNELRVARQVSHKNVCRLYDLGDADGRRFLTMEYVDGEDLSRRRCGASAGCRRTRRCRSRGSCAPASPPPTSAACCTATSNRPT